MAISATFSLASLPFLRLALTKDSRRHHSHRNLWRWEQLWRACCQFWRGCVTFTDSVATIALNCLWWWDITRSSFAKGDDRRGQCHAAFSPHQVPLWRAFMCRRLKEETIRIQFQKDIGAKWTSNNVSITNVRSLNNYSTKCEYMYQGKHNST